MLSGAGRTAGGLQAGLEPAQGHVGKWEEWGSLTGKNRLHHAARSKEAQEKVLTPGCCIPT